MLTIIIGLLIFAILYLIACKIGEIKCLFILPYMIVVLGLGFLALSLYFGICGLDDYNDWELVEETPLVSLSNTTASEGHGTLFYVSISAENVYTYRYEIDSEFSTGTSKEYKIATLDDNFNVIESEDPNCTKPVLLHYRRYPKKSIWTFGLGSDDIYDFYVPEGSITKEINLK